MKPGLYVFYKHIQICGKAHFSKEKPLLICGNHVNAFMDPVALQLHASRPLYSLARGDAFQKPWARSLLNRLYILPIYRKSEGADNLDKNEASFTRSAQLLQVKQAIIIYPEAICVQERRIRKLKKGAARIAFETAMKSQFATDLQVLPVGMNYSMPYQFRSDLFIQIGEPIAIQTYKQAFEENPTRAMVAFTNELEQALRKITIHNSHTATDGLLELLYQLYFPALYLQEKIPAADLLTQFNLQKQTVQLINESYLKNPEPFHQLEDQLKAFTIQNPWAHPKLIKASRAKWSSAAFLLMVGFPIYMLGLLVHGIPFAIGKVLSSKLAKNIEFKASLQMSISWLLWSLGYLSQAVVVSLLPISIVLKCGIVLLIAPLLGLLTLFYFDLQNLYWPGFKMLFTKGLKNRQAVKNEFARLMGQCSAILAKN